MRVGHKIEINKNDEPYLTQPSQPTQKKAKNKYVKIHIKNVNGRIIGQMCSV